MAEVKIERVDQPPKKDPLRDEAPAGIATSLQPGGTIPGKSPAAGLGSMGTGDAATGNQPTGAMKDRS